MPETVQMEVEAPESKEVTSAFAFAIRVVSFGMTVGFLIHSVRWW
jgi:hypothetical protein